MNTKRSRTALYCLSSLNLVLTGWMTWHALSGQAVAGCSAQESCNDLMTGPWAYIAGIIPISSLAFGAYLAALCCLAGTRSRDTDTARLSWRMLLLLAGCITGMALWMTGLQAFLLKTFCKYCMTAHVVGLAASALVIIATHKTVGLPAARRRMLAAGLGLAVAVAAVQAIFKADAKYLQGTAQDPLPAFSAAEYPHIGSPDAPLCVELMFDYRCSHCRQMHAMLPQVIELSGGRLAFVTLPTPLSNGCNYYLPQGPDQFKGSCQLAKLAMAIWQAAPAKLDEFEQWVWMEGPDGWYPPEPDQARQKAVQLIGEEALAQYYESPWSQDYFTRVYELFGRTMNAQGGGIPRLVYGQQWMVADADSPQALYDLILTLTGLVQ